MSASVGECSRRRPVFCVSQAIAMGKRARTSTAAGATLDVTDDWQDRARRQSAANKQRAAKRSIQPAASALKMFLWWVLGHVLRANKPSNSLGRIQVCTSGHIEPTCVLSRRTSARTWSTVTSSSRRWASSCQRGAEPSSFGAHTAVTVARVVASGVKTCGLEVAMVAVVDHMRALGKVFLFFCFFLFLLYM